MTTATTDAEIAQEIEVRWEMANYSGIQRYAGEPGITLTLTKRRDRITEDLEELAAMLVPDGVWDDEANEDEDSLEQLIGQTWDEIEKRFKAWAARYPERRQRIAIAMRTAQQETAVAS